jgi:hypothetical protein
MSDVRFTPDDEAFLFAIMNAIVPIAWIEVERIKVARHRISFEKTWRLRGRSHSS